MSQGYNEWSHLNHLLGLTMLHLQYFSIKPNFNRHNYTLSIHPTTKLTCGGVMKNVSKLFGLFFFFVFFLVGWIFVCNMKYVNTRTATGQELLSAIHNPCLFIFLPQKLFVLFIERNNNSSMGSWYLNQ